MPLPFSLAIVAQAGQPLFLQFEDLLDHRRRHGITLGPRANQQRLGHRQRQRQVNPESRTVCHLRQGLDPAAQRSDFGFDHVHADATPGHLAQLSRRRETRLENEIIELRIVDRGTRCQQAHRLGTGADQSGIETFAIIGQGQDDFIAFLSQFQRDFADFRLAGSQSLLTTFDAVRHGIAQHVLERRQHLVEDRTVNIDLTIGNVEIGAFADILGGLPDDPVKTVGLAGERNHPDGHQFLLQAAVQTRLGDDRRVGVIQVFQQVLLYRRNVVHRLGHEARQFLEAREAVEFERIELGHAFVGHPRLNLAFRLNFDFAQLAAQTNDVFGQIKQRALQVAHFAFDTRPGNGQFAGFVDQPVDQIGTHAQRTALCRSGRIGLALRFAEVGWQGSRFIVGLQPGLDNEVSTGAESVYGLGKSVEAGFKLVEERRSRPIGLECFINPCFQQMSQLAQIHRPGHAGIAFESVQQAGDGLGMNFVVRCGTPGAQIGREIAQLIGCFFQEEG